MFGFLAKIGLGGTKSKIFLGIILTMSLLGGLLYLRYDTVKESLILANKEIQDVAQELQTSEKTIENLERDIRLESRLLSEKEEERRESQQMATSLSAQLEKEKNTNEPLKQCLPVNMSGYTNGVREFRAYQNSDRDNSNNAE